MDWLLAMAPYVNVDYNSDFFLEELERLVDVSPAEVSLVMRAFLESYVPSFDFEDRLMSILQKLAQHGKRKDAIAFAEKLRQLPGMIQFYSTVCRTKGSNNWCAALGRLIILIPILGEWSRVSPALTLSLAAHSLVLVGA